jgi:muramidase (phage lysozyme)
MPRIDAQAAGGANVCAFLDMLAWSELGPGLLEISDDGYNVIVGSTARAPIFFAGYADHPRRLIEFPKLGIGSTAAGRYQLLARYFDAYRRQLGLKDFSPAAQDKIAIQQLRETRALPLILSGDVTGAIARCRKIWASLPGAGYGQNEHKLGDLQVAFVNAGGRRA